MTRVSTTSVRVVDQRSVIVDRNGYRSRLHHEARVVEIYDGAAHRRSIVCADDGGRWTFETVGEPFSIESTFDYSPRLKRRRFMTE